MNPLINTPCSLIRRTESGNADEYGNDIPDEEIVETVCEIQQLTRKRMELQDDVSDTTWTAFFLAGETVHAADALIVDDVEYELIGEPWPVRDSLTSRVDHIEGTIKRAAGDEPGGAS